MTATISSITYKPKDAAPDTDGEFTRVDVQEANLIEGYGIEGDRKGGNPKRQINIMTSATLAALNTEGFNTTPGQMGEQMIIDGLDIDALPIGTRIKLGDSAEVEITVQRTGCDRFEGVQQLSANDAAGRLGMLVKVVHSGKVRVGDAVQVTQTPVSS